LYYVKELAYLASAHTFLGKQADSARPARVARHEMEGLEE
jgi:hypothetical protein